MFAYLDLNSLAEVQAAAVQANLANPDSRRTLLSGIDVRFIAGLPYAGNPAEQLLLDLTMLNRQQRLTDGTVPLAVWLSTASALTPLQDVQQVFRKHLDTVIQKASGEPPAASALTHVPDANERIVHQDDMLPLGFLAGALATARSVVKMEIPRHNNGVLAVDGPGRPQLYLGTGWLLAPRIVLTNHHVVNARESGEPVASAQDFSLQGGGATVVFDFDAESRPGQRVSATAVVAADATLDYAVVRLTDDLGRPALTLAREPLRKPPSSYSPVNIVQHPLGGAKMIAIRNNLVREIAEREIQYFTDTLFGSSGSPVLDDKWQVVALHRASRNVTDVNFQGKATAYVNVGTPIGVICQHIRNNYPALWAEIAPVVAK